MINAFDSEVAELVGVNAAVIFKNIEFWVEKNSTTGRNEHDGRYWTYNSVKAYAEQFPYFSEGQIRKALEKLKEEGLILTGCYNDTPYDRTTWYTLTDRGISVCKNKNIHLAKNTNVFEKQNKTIISTDDYQIDNQITTTEAAENPKEGPSDCIEEGPDHHGWEHLLKQAMDAYNKTFGTSIAFWPVEAREGIHLAYDSGRTMADILAVIHYVENNWEAKYITPRSVFGERFETTLSQARKEGELDAGYEEFDRLAEANSR